MLEAQNPWPPADLQCQKLCVGLSSLFNKCSSWAQCTFKFANLSASENLPLLLLCVITKSNGGYESLRNSPHLPVARESKIAAYHETIFFIFIFVPIKWVFHWCVLLQKIHLTFLLLLEFEFTFFIFFSSYSDHKSNHFSYLIYLGLPNLTNKNVRYPVKFEFQKNNITFW